MSPNPVSTFGAGLGSPIKMSEFSKTFSMPMEADLGCKRVVVETSVPALPGDGAAATFAEHVQREGRATDMVVACGHGSVVVSEDLGASWNLVSIPEMSDVRFRNSFTMADGTHLLQGANASGGAVATRHGFAPVAILDSSWRFVDCVSPGYSVWHGTRSIDEAGGVIIYAEYPVHTAKPGLSPAAGAESRPRRARLEDRRVLRSTDGGRSWEVTLRVDWRTARHFHTVVADRWCPGRWWVSSGDGPAQCRVWESRDHGLSWTEISVELPTAELHPAQRQYAQAVMRHTDIVVREDDIIWGTDDYLGEPHLHDLEVDVGRRAGARLLQSPKGQPWSPRTIGYVGNPVRSLVDAGPAYLVITEAKGPLGFRPQVLLLWKTEPLQLTPLMTIDNFRSERPGTAFTASRASLAAKDGVFFTYRGKTDAFPNGARILRWRVLFD